MHIPVRKHDGLGGGTPVTLEVMVRNIGRELAEIQQAIGRCRGIGWRSCG